MDETTIRITELPVRKWTQDYKELLEGMMNPTDKVKESFIKVRFSPKLIQPIMLSGEEDLKGSLHNLCYLHRTIESTTQIHV